MPGKQTVIQENEAGQSFFFLAEGQVKVTRQGRLLNMIDKKEFFGEMAYIRGGELPRHATVESMTQLLIAEFDPDALSRMTIGAQLQAPPAPWCAISWIAWNWPTAASDAEWRLPGVRLFAGAPQRGGRRKMRRRPPARSASPGISKRIPVPAGGTMALTLPESVRTLLADKAYGHVITFNPSGTPQVTMVWMDVDGNQAV